MIRMLGVVALLSGIAYLVTPLTAAGPQTSPTAFEVNLRYASPALALGALLLAVDPVLSRERAQHGAAGRPRRSCSLVGLAERRVDDVWERDFLVGSDPARGLLIAVPVALALRPALGPRPPDDRRRRGARDRPGDRRRLAQERRLPRRPLPGRHRARRLPRWHPLGARAASTRRTRATPASPWSAVARASSSTSSTATTSPTTSSTSPTRAHGPSRRSRPTHDSATRACEEWLASAQRRRLRLRRDRARPAHPGAARRSRPTGPAADPAASRCSRTTYLRLRARRRARPGRPAHAQSTRASAAAPSRRAPNRPPDLGVLRRLPARRPRPRRGRRRARARRRSAARRGLLPGWEGAPARLVEAVLGLSLLTIMLQLLGAVGLFEPWSPGRRVDRVGAGVALRRPPRRRPRTRTPRRSPAHRPALAPRDRRWSRRVFLAAHWATGLQDVWARGMLTFDTLWYHGPFAARIAERARSGRSTSPTRST